MPTTTGCRDSGESGLQGVVVALTGTDYLGAAVNLTAVTDFAGLYRFARLKAGTYTVTETQPTGGSTGSIRSGTPALGATAQANDTLGSVHVPADVQYGEHQQ